MNGLQRFRKQWEERVKLMSDKELQNWLTEDLYEIPLTAITNEIEFRKTTIDQ